MLIKVGMTAVELLKIGGDDIFIASMEKEKRLTSESSTSNH